MLGLLEAATVIGTLMYGAEHVWKSQTHFYLHVSPISCPCHMVNFMFLMDTEPNTQLHLW